MKLRNKKTGEIVENAYIRESHDFYNKRTIAVFVRDGNRPPERVSTGYESLAELNEEWEDYEEPLKEYWYIDADGKLICEPSDDKCKFDNNCREIGNYFETKEEAELAVRKLKAWKRLKDKGFRFEWWKEADNRLQYNTITFNRFVYNYEDREQLRKDLDLLFCTEVKND